MPSSDALIPCVLYAAKSTEDKAGSIPTQLEDGRKMAEREGWKIIGEYEDEGFSAYHANRGPDLEAAKQAVATAAGDGGAILVVQHSDRLARGAGDAPGASAHFSEIIDWAIRNSVTIRTVQDDFYADPRTARLMAAAMGQRNYEDSERKSRSVKDGLARNAARGIYHGRRPLGYRKRKRDGQLIIVEDEAPVVRRIFAEYVAGRSTLAIARGLEDDGARTARGMRWHPAAVRKILTHPVYVGKIAFKGEVFDGQHEPIIDGETWERASDLLAANAQRPGKGRGRRPKGNHLFYGGMLTCDECGGSMHPRQDGDCYRCATRMRLGPDACSMPNLPRAEIDTTVYRYFERVGLDVEATRDALAEARGARLAEVRALRASAERELARAEAAAERVEPDYLAGDLSAENYERLTAKAADEFVAARAEVERLKASEGEVERDGEALDAEREVLEQLTAIRRAIAGEIKNAEGVEAVRAALTRLRLTFTVSVPKDGRATIKPHRDATIRFDLTTDPPVFEVASRPPERVGLRLANKSAKTLV